MKINRLLYFFLLPLFILMTSCSNTSRTLDDIIDSNQLIVGMNAEFPPFEYKNGSNYLGIDVDIIKEYAKYIGVSCQINDMDFDATFLSVYSSKVDLAISGITVNEKRMKKFDFTNAYYYSSQVVIVNTDSNYLNASSMEDILSLLSNTKANIGVQRGTTGEYFASGDDSWGFDGISNTLTISYDTGALACKDLSDKKISAVIIDEAPAKLIASKYSNLKVLPYILTQEEYAIAIKKGNTTLLESLNEFISIINENGTLDEIVERYYA